jgi:hypothetical protein
MTSMSAAKKKLGAGYDAIFGRNHISLDKQAVADLFKLHQSVGNDLEASQAAVARKQIEKILDNAGQAGSMPGKVYQNLRGQLRDGFGKESPLGRKVMEARKILDDAASRSLGPSDAAALKVLNGQYANIGTVRDALKQVAGAGGNVKPVRALEPGQERQHEGDARAGEDRPSAAKRPDPRLRHRWPIARHGRGRDGGHGRRLGSRASAGEAAAARCHRGSCGEQQGAGELSGEREQADQWIGPPAAVLRR